MCEKWRRMAWAVVFPDASDVNTTNLRPEVFVWAEGRQKEFLLNMTGGAWKSKWASSYWGLLIF